MKSFFRFYFVLSLFLSANAMFVVFLTFLDGFKMAAGTFWESFFYLPNIMFYIFTQVHVGLIAIHIIAGVLLYRFFEESKILVMAIPAGLLLHHIIFVLTDLPATEFSTVTYFSLLSIAFIVPIFSFAVAVRMLRPKRY